MFSEVQKEDHEKKKNTNFRFHLLYFTLCSANYSMLSVWFCFFLSFGYFIKQKKKVKKNLYKMKYKIWDRLFVFIKKIKN